MKSHWLSFLIDFGQTSASSPQDVPVVVVAAASSGGMRHFLPIPLSWRTWLYFLHVWAGLANLAENRGLLGGLWWVTTAHFTHDGGGAGEGALDMCKILGHLGDLHHLRCLLLCLLPSNSEITLKEIWNWWFRQSEMGVRTNSLHT